LLDEADRVEVSEYVTTRHFQFSPIPTSLLSGFEDTESPANSQFTEAVRGLGKVRKKGATVVQFQ
jgi:hypothetical protein